MTATPRRRAVRSGMLVVAANVTEILVNTVRNILLARLLSVSDFGVAATFTLLFTMLDFAGQMGLGRMVVQARDAEDPRLQATLHSVQLLLGVVAALVMLAIAWPYAAAMATPALGWAYATLALIPLLRGLIHLDTQRLQRQGRFGPWAIRQIVPPIASLLVIYPAWLVFRDFRVALVSIYVQQAGLLLASFVGAERPYALARDLDIMRRALAFGWPVMVNALLMYVVINGDRLIVGNQFGVVALGWFSAAITLTLMPMNFVAKTVQTALLPTLARHQDDVPVLQRQYDLSVSMAALITVGFTAALALLGPLLLQLTFGAKFAPAAPFLVLLGLGQGFRLIRAAPALVAMAKAETKNPLYTNLLRGAFILVAFAVAVASGDITAMLLVGIAGEVASAVLAAWLVRRMLGLAARHSYLVLGATIVLAGSICLVALYGWPLWLVVPAAVPFLFAVRDLFRSGHRLLRPAGRAA